LIRFALNPTQDITVEDLRVALFNHILSKQLNEELLIRVDDADKKKTIENKDKEIIDILNLFSIDYSKVVYQSENIKYHTQMAMKLLLDKKAFNCFCSDEALEKDKQIAKKENQPYSYSGFCESISDETKFNCNAPFVVRLKKPKNNLIFTDILQNDLEYKPSDVDSCIILDHDKSPTLNYASAVDDMLYDISLIIKKQNQLIETSQQIHIRNLLGYEKEIKHIHLPLLDNIDNKNLSVSKLIEQGYLPVAIANYLISLGYETPKKIFSLEEAIQWFDISKISQDRPIFDIQELNLINKEYLKNIDDMRLSKILKFADNDIGTLAKIYLDECSTTKELKEKIDTIFKKKERLDSFEKECLIIKECLKDAPFIDSFEDLQNYVTSKTNLTDEKLDKPLKFILTGSLTGPDASQIYPLIKNYLGEIIK